MATSTIKQVMNNSGTKYCKMPDGTLIQWGKITISIPTKSSAEGTVVFPLSYVGESPMVTANVCGYYTPYTEITGPSVVYAGELTCKFRIYNTYSESIDVPICWIAIGRWK